MRGLVDHRQQRIDDVAGARHEGESPGRQRRDDGHVFRVGADDGARRRAPEVDAAGGLSITEAAMMTARMINITSIKGEVGLMPNPATSTSSPTSPQPQADARGARAHPDGRQHDEKLQNDGEVIFLLL